MIYAGLFYWNEAPDSALSIASIIESYTNVPANLITKNHLTLVYSKQNNQNDFDEVFKNDSSVLIGRIFNKLHGLSCKQGDFMSVPFLEIDEALKNIWGKYLYIHEKESELHVVLDPTGELPFFYHPLSNGNVLFSSDIEIIFKILKQKPEYNWAYLCSYLMYGNSSAEQTPFKNIYELPPACRLKITKDNRRVEPYWNPWSFYKRSNPETTDPAGILQSSMKLWVAPFKNICVSLSGGLDSSALVYCLKSLKNDTQTLTAINYYHSSIKSSNELNHARKVSDEAGIHLTEIDASNFLPFDPYDQKNCLRPNKPFPGLIHSRWRETVSEHVPTDGPSILISGHGSDQIFMRPPCKKSLSDYVLEKGLIGASTHLKNLAQYYREPIFSLLWENMKSLGLFFLNKHIIKRLDPKNNDAIPGWVTEDARNMSSANYIHPMYKHLPTKHLPAKYVQIDSIYEAVSSIHMERELINPVHYPFLFEPVIECALSIPAYKFLDKGYDRYPLRKSINDHFKTETVWRRDKSQITGLLQLGVKKNLNYVLDLCLEGQLGKCGFIDREGLRQTITLISTGDAHDLFPFMYIASLEMFLKYWEDSVFD